MNFIEWTNDISVGQANLDEHHRMIIDCLNRLHPLLNASGKEEEIREVLDALEDFVLVHFSEEERVMKAAGYPDWAAHKLLHDGMYDLVFRLKADLSRGRVPEAGAIFELLYNWLVKHIMGEDRKYIPYLDNPQPEAKALWHRASGRPY
jgi:hemerythrin-like metal-binding protein